MDLVRELKVEYSAVHRTVFILHTLPNVADHVQALRYLRENGEDGALRSAEAARFEGAVQTVEFVSFPVLDAVVRQRVLGDVSEVCRAFVDAQGRAGSLRGTGLVFSAVAGASDEELLSLLLRVPRGGSFVEWAFSL